VDAKTEQFGMTNHEMSDREMAGRDLTSLEYIVMGLISLQPQSGYSIMHFFDADSIGMAASAGTIYPILKRLEKQGIIEGELEMEYEARPRKLYRLSKAGEQLLDGWLREIPRIVPRYEQRELAMWRFQFMEGRLTQREILQWLDNYLDMIRIYDYGQRLFQDGTLAAMRELGQTSVHRQLIMEATLMEINTLRTWLELARARIAAMASAEYKAAAVPPKFADVNYDNDSGDSELGDLG
jgi:DNA-binding PadR family transcriptional regulator